MEVSALSEPLAIPLAILSPDFNLALDKSTYVKGILWQSALTLILLTWIIW
jgi:hypothetical protein